MTDPRFEAPLRAADRLIEARRIYKKHKGRVAEILFSLQEHAGVGPEALARHIDRGNLHAEVIRAHPAVARAMEREAGRRQHVRAEVKKLARILNETHKKEMNGVFKAGEKDPRVAKGIAAIRRRALRVVGRKAAGIREAFWDYPAINIHNNIVRRAGEEKGFDQLLYYLGVAPHRIVSEAPRVLRGMSRGRSLGNERFNRAIARFARQVQPSMDSWREDRVRRGLRSRRI